MTRIQCHTLCSHILRIRSRYKGHVARPVSTIRDDLQTIRPALNLEFLESGELSIGCGLRLRPEAFRHSHGSHSAILGWCRGRLGLALPDPAPPTPASATPTTSRPRPAR